MLSMVEAKEFRGPTERTNDHQSKDGLANQAVHKSLHLSFILADIVIKVIMFAHIQDTVRFSGQGNVRRINH